MSFTYMFFSKPYKKNTSGTPLESYFLNVISSQQVLLYSIVDSFVYCTCHNLFKNRKLQLAEQTNAYNYQCSFDENMSKRKTFLKIHFSFFSHKLIYMFPRA
jgi:hypothetical protein